MKKVLLSIIVVAACSFTTLLAQPPGGGQQMTPEQRMAQMKDRLKEMNVTGVQADSVVAIMMDRSMMANMGNFRDMTPEDRQAKMKEIGEARVKRMVKAGVAEDTAKKIVEAMGMRGGGQRPPGGNRK